MYGITKELWFQGILVSMSLSSSFIIGNKGPSRKWAYILGLSCQPLWAWTAWESELWGWFFLTVCYFFTWIRGCLNHWRAK